MPRFWKPGSSCSIFRRLNTSKLALKAKNRILKLSKGDLQVADTRAKATSQSKTEGAVHMNRSIPGAQQERPLPVIKPPQWLAGFVDFIREQGVVGLAVGLILGVAAKSVVDSLVQNVFNPLIGLFYGGGDFSTKFFCLKSSVESGKSVCKSKLGYGSFINALISFVIVAASVYFLIKMLKLDKLYKKKDD